MTNGMIEITKDLQWNPLEFASKTPRNTFLLIRDCETIGGPYQKLEDNIRGLNAIRLGQGKIFTLIFSHEDEVKLSKKVFKGVGLDCKAMLILLSKTAITPKDSLQPKKNNG